MRKTMKRSMLATMVALCCGTVAGQALAQEAAATAQDEADATGKAAEPIELERVIATAQKRRENIMEVAAGISVISESRLESLNATRLTDFASYIPGFTVGNGDAPGMTSLALRGVAPLSGGATIASYIDDTPIGASGNKQRATSLSLDLLPYDVESIEVLRGPQGTLYGASAMGGLMKYVTKSADPDAFEFRAGTDINSVSGAGQLGTGVRTAFNVPLIEGRLGLRASFARQSTPGYIDEPSLGKRDANGYSQLASRLALTWRISDNIDLRVQGLWQVVDADGTSQVGLDFNSHELLNGRFGGIAQVPESFRTETDYTAATLDWDLGWADFVSASSLSDTRSTIVTDETLAYGAYWPELGNYAPGLADFQIALSTHKWTQELRLNSKQSDRFEWLIGTFLTGEKHGNAQQVHAYDAQHRLLPFNPAAIVALPGTFREQALFADATYKFSPRFDISAGVRAARNKQSFSQLTDGVLFGERVDLQGDSDESVNTWKLATRWNLGEDAMLYARYATGYRPGGANVALPGIPRMTRSDTLTNLELGFKSHFWNRRAMIDAALFRIDWDDLQVGAASDEGIGYDANAGTARSNGIEVAFMLLPTERLTWGINAAYIDAELGNDVPASSGLRPGTRMPLTPRVSWSTTLDYAFELGGNWRGQLGGGYRYVGDRVGIRGVQYDPQKALDLHAEISNSTWTVRLYARNATDESTFTSKGEVSNVLGQNMLVIGTPVQPRTVGMSLDYRF